MNITNNIESNFNDGQQYNNFSKVKKIIKIFLYIVIGFNIFSLLVTLLLFLFQNIILKITNPNLVNDFLYFPFNAFIRRFVISGIVISFSFIYIKKINNNKTRCLNLILFFSIFNVFKLFFQNILNIIFNNYIERINLTSSMLKFLMLDNYTLMINEYILFIPDLLFVLSIGMLIAISLSDKKNK